MKTQEKVKTQIWVKQIRSLIGQPQSTRLIMRSLGLGKIGRSKILPDNPAIRGMVEKVQHLALICLQKEDHKNG